MTLTLLPLPLRRAALALVLLGQLAMAQHPGSAAPDFRLLDLDGRVRTLAEFRGAPLLLNFWASWCPPCQAELPLLQRLSDDVPELRLLLVNAGEGRETAARFLAERNLTLVSAADPTPDAPGGDAAGEPLDDTLEVARRYRVRGLPTTVFIDAEGNVASVFVGELSAKVLTERLAQLGVSWQP